MPSQGCYWQTRQVRLALLILLQSVKFLSPKKWKRVLNTMISLTTRAFMDIKNQCSGCCSTKVVRSWFHGILFRRLSLLVGQTSSMLNHKCWSTPNKFLMYVRSLTTKSQVSLVRQTKLKLLSFKNHRVILYRNLRPKMLSVWAVIRVPSFYWSQTVLLLLSKTRTSI